MTHLGLAAKAVVSIMAAVLIGGIRRLSGAAAAVGDVAVARSGRRVDQLRVRVGGVGRGVHTRLRAAAPAFGP